MVVQGSGYGLDLIVNGERRAFYICRLCQAALSQGAIKRMGLDRAMTRPRPSRISEKHRYGAHRTAERYTGGSILT